MKLIPLKCPNCGAQLNVDANKESVYCEHCGTRIMIDDEINRLQIDNAEEAGYQFEKGRQRAQSEVQQRSSQASTKNNYQPSRKKRKTWLWVLGWIFIFPIPLTILLLRKKDMKPGLKYGLIAIAWLVYLLIAFLGRPSSDAPALDSSESAETDLTIIATEVPKETEQSKTDTPIPTDQTAVSPEPTKVVESSQTVGDHYDESLNGRGLSDSGRSEPNYLNVIGYVALSASISRTIEKTDSFQNTELWIVPTYERDKQFWNENGHLAHKTEVVVREQFLEHKGYGSYSGYLRVEKVDDGAEYYIDVKDFVTKPYWKYTDDMRTAALTGTFIAEYKQVSDFYPVTSDGKKVEIPDGTIVLVTGIGTAKGVKQEDNGIEAIVWKEWRNGYGGVDCFFNPADLTIVY